MKNWTVMTASVATLVFTVLTAAQPVLAEESSTTRATVDEVAPTRLSDLGMHLNPQIGTSSFEYSGRGGSTGGKFAGGATVEFGEGIRRAETGLLLIPTGGHTILNDGSSAEVTSEYLAVPMMAKIRVMQMPSQSWYIKAGALTAFEVGSSKNSVTNNIDIMASLGLGGRFVFTRTADFIVEATYNRGLLDAVRSAESSTSDYNQGVLVLAGVSFKL